MYANVINVANIFITVIYSYKIARYKLRERRALHVCKVQTFLYLPKENSQLSKPKKKKLKEKSF